MTHHGKWNQPGIPHKGWACVGIGDLENDRIICEMCESQEIRYVHYMSHQDYPTELAVGCVCAEYLEQDYNAPKEREKLLRNKSGRRKNWLKRRWRKSARNNEFLNTDGFNIVIVQRGNMWSFVIKIIETDSNYKRALRTFETQEKAKLAAFDGMIYLKQKHGLD